MTTTPGQLPKWLKQTLSTVSVLWALLGVPLMFGCFCGVLVLVAEGESDFSSVGLAVFGFSLVLLTGGAGSLVAWHASRSLAGKPSHPLRLFPAWLWALLFALGIVSGSLIVQQDLGTVLFFPPVLLATATIPPLLAMAWFIPQSADGLTWRRGLVAFVGGATVSVFIALVLEILLPLIVLALVAGLTDTVLPHLEALLSALDGQRIAEAIASPSFVFIFIELAVIAPLAEEFAKPLVTLPILRYLTRREAFLVAAMAGAGFAALENVIYAGSGFSFWAGILIVRALGGAIHPLGAGLVGLGWRDVLRGEPQAGRKWATRFGLAVGMHALWNGGSLLVITLAGAQFFGDLPPEINVLGLSAAGTTLALLVVLGLVALWIGRGLVRETEPPALPGDESASREFILTDRAVAIWALACLVAIVPAGIAGLQLLMR
jgi:RsiW-degrading membrane proteinase PrsW (M82 family)